MSQRLVEFRLLTFVCEASRRSRMQNLGKKSVCMRIGPMHNASCLPISLSNDVEFQWVNEVRYLDVFIVRPRLFNCSLDHAKNRFIVQPMRSLGR